jgi:serine/threonine-protein kinase HipA
VKHVSVIEVRLWGQRVGAVALDPRLGYYAFAYAPAWRRTGIELAPLTLPLSDRSATFIFPNLPDATFHRLPGMLADALPDAFGNALIDAWMAERGLTKSEVTTLDRLAYMRPALVWIKQSRSRTLCRQSVSGIAQRADAERQTATPDAPV